MPIIETLELLNVVSDTANLSTEITTPSGANSQLSLYPDGNSPVLGDSPYDENVRRRLLDIELKTYTTDLKHKGYPTNPPLTGDDAAVACSLWERKVIGLNPILLI